MGCSTVLRRAVSSTCFEYDTPKTVHIHSKSIGILNRLVQLAIISYVVGYIFFAHKGYQYIDHGAISGTTTKLKGVAYTNATDDPRVGEHLWDTADLVVPPEENNAFFVTTNIITTYNQTQGECPEFENDFLCDNDSDCEPLGSLLHAGHGRSTGRCDKIAKRCNIVGWCPVENDNLPAAGRYATLRDTKDWTVMIKNHVYFPYYDRTRSNFIESVTYDYLGGCIYNHEQHPYCPILRLSDIVSLAETKKEASLSYDDKWYEALAIKGGVVSIKLKWDCNFDYEDEKCKPTYSFDRLDKYKGNSLGSGYNFRYPVYYYENGVRKRDLVKAYGILFILEVEASARAFDFVTFTLNLGSGIALLGMAAICSDIILVYLHRKKNFFKQHIVHDITEAEPNKTSKRDFSRSSTNFTECPMNDQISDREALHPPNGNSK